MIRYQLAALDGLKKGVVEVPRYASAFGQPFIKARANGSCQLPHSQPTECPDNGGPGNDAQSQKPPGLVPRCRDAEVHGRAYIIPDTVVIACDHTKPICSRTKICVECLPTAPGIYPALVPALQLVSVS